MVQLVKGTHVHLIVQFPLHKCRLGNRFSSRSMILLTRFREIVFNASTACKVRPTIEVGSSLSLLCPLVMDINTFFVEEPVLLQLDFVSLPVPGANEKRQETVREPGRSISPFIGLSMPVFPGPLLSSIRMNSCFISVRDRNPRHRSN